jgi:hypothetical protein
MKTSRFLEVEQLANGSSADKIIEIRSVYKTGKHTVQPAFDKREGWYAGVERLSDEEKKARPYNVTVGLTDKEARLNTKLVLESGLSFNLNNTVDKINWAWVMHLPCLAMSFKEAQKGKALFYVHIEGREAEESNKRTEDIFEAESLVKNDPASNHVNRALLLGFDMEGENPAAIKEFLYTIAKSSPDKIFRVFRDKAMKIHLLFAKAKKANIITEDKTQGVFRYGSHILGVSDDACIAFLQQNSDILDLLEREINPEYYTQKTEKIGSEVASSTEISDETPIAKARRIKAEEDAKKK